MMLAETEYRHQIETVIRPFRDILLGPVLHFGGHAARLAPAVREFALVSRCCSWRSLLIKAADRRAASRGCSSIRRFKALRTGIVMSVGGEFGIALLTLAAAGPALLPPRSRQPLLVAMVLSMVLSPFILGNNKRIARLLLRREGAAGHRARARGCRRPARIAEREHVILCGFGRVGQNVARVLESQGFEYIALDLDPARIRAARQAGDPVMYGDSSDEEMLQQAGLENASAVVISFSDPAHRARHPALACDALRADVPVLVRTQDDGAARGAQGRPAPRKWCPRRSKPA